MAKKLTLKDVLNKLSYVFPDDAYIKNNRFVVEGEKSEKRNCGYYAVYLPENIVEILDETYSREDIIFFSDIKKAKASLGTKDMEKYITIYKKDEIRKELEKDIDGKISELINTPLSHEKWIPFDLRGEQIEDILNNKNVKYYLNDDKYIILSKSLLPMINKSSFSDLSFYHFYNMMENKEEINTVVIQFNHEVFQIFLTFKYLL